MTHTEEWACLTGTECSRPCGKWTIPCKTVLPLSTLSTLASCAWSSSGQISVVETPTFEESEWKTMFNLRGSEEREILESSHWLCIESTSYHTTGTRSTSWHRTCERRCWDSRSGAPKGWTGIIVNSEVTNDGIRKVFENANLRRGQAVVSRWARLRR